MLRLTFLPHHNIYYRAVWDDYGKKWNTIYNPYDQDMIEEVLESSRYAHYRLPDYYMFKRIYQQVFRKPYEDDFYLVYGERFYGASPKWHSRLNYYFDVFNDAFYERLEGMEP